MKNVRKRLLQKITEKLTIKIRSDDMKPYNK